MFWRELFIPKIKTMMKSRNKIINNIENAGVIMGEENVIELI